MAQCIARSEAINAGNLLIDLIQHYEELDMDVDWQTSSEDLPVDAKALVSKCVVSATSGYGRIAICIEIRESITHPTIGEDSTVLWASAVPALTKLLNSFAPLRSQASAFLSQLSVSHRKRARAGRVAAASKSEEDPAAGVLAEEVGKLLSSLLLFADPPSELLDARFCMLLGA